jgi:hypothetical protein
LDKLIGYPTPKKEAAHSERPLAFQTVKQAGCSSTDQELRKQRSPLFFHCQAAKVSFAAAQPTSKNN